MLYVKDLLKATQAKSTRRIDLLQNTKIELFEFQEKVNEWVRNGLLTSEVESRLQAFNILAYDGEEKIVLRPKFKITVSNLNGGLVIYFLCDSCGKGFRELFYINSDLQCRFCHNLRYRKSSKRDKLLNELIMQPKIREDLLRRGGYFNRRKVLDAEQILEQLSAQKIKELENRRIFKFIYEKPIPKE